MTYATVKTLSHKEIIEALKRNEAEEMEYLRRIDLYQRENKLEFFDKPPNKGPNPKQAQIFDAFPNPAFKTFVLHGGNRLGKTFSLSAIVESVMFGKYLWNNQSLMHLFPHKNPRKVRYVGQDWHDHVQTVVIPELEKWWPGARKVEKHGNGIIKDTFWKDMQSGSTLQIMSNKQDPGDHEGWSGDLLVYDEPPRREIYIANARGLTDRRGKEVFGITMLKEAWIDREIIKKVDKDGKPDSSVFCVQGTSYDNVGYGITVEGVEDFRSKLTEEEVQTRIYGVPSYLQGLVYQMFNRKDHLCPHFTIPLNWMVDIAIDVHPRERQAVMFMAVDERGEKYVCDEIWDYGDGTQTGEAIVRKVHRNDYRVNRIIIDPLAKGDRNNPETTYQKIANVLARYDLPLETATKDLDAGILSVKRHLKGPNNRPSLFLLDNCPRTLYEIEGYMWDKKNPGKVSDVDDHQMENLYRICLLNTRYIEPEEEGVLYAENFDAGRNRVTGY